MAEAESTRQRVDELIRTQPRGDGTGVVESLDRLCRAASDELALLGAASTLLPDVGAHVVSASSPLARSLEEAQFGVGEGPTRSAFGARRPVLVHVLDDVGALRWPAWTRIASAAGVEAVYALPLHVGATNFGVLTLYAGQGGALGEAALETAFVFTDVATELLLDGSIPERGQLLARDLNSALDTHAHVYQAQGMVMVALDVSLPEALARMRAHAWVADLDLATLAGEIVAGRTMPSRDFE